LVSLANAKLAGDGRIATGDVKEVPVGLYAKAALEKLGVWPSVESKMAMTVNVRAALAYAARAETLAKIEPGVESRRRFPRGFDRLPGGGDRERQAGEAPISGVSAVCGDQIDIRGLRLLGAGKAHE
jgi:hypothetical protein